MAILTRVVGALTFTSLMFLINRFAINNKQDLGQLRTLNVRNGHTPSTIPRLRMFESSGHFALVVLREWSITCSKYVTRGARSHFFRSSLLKVEQSMSKVLSALSAGCDSALLRSGWESLHLVQPDEPMWKPSWKSQLLLKPLLIARTLLNGILTTVVFFSKKVVAINCQAICPRCSRVVETQHELICSWPKLSLMKAVRPTNWVVTPNSLVRLQSTIVTLTATTLPELGLADCARESLYCGETLDVVKPSTQTSVSPKSLTLFPLEVPEGLGLTDTILASTPSSYSTNGMADVAVSPNSSNGVTPPLCM